MVLILSLSSSIRASSINSQSTQTMIETETGLRMLYIEQHNIKQAIEKLETEQAQMKTQMIQLEEQQENAMHQYEAFIREIESYEEEYSKAWKKMLPILTQIKTQQKKKNSQTKIPFYQSLTAAKDIVLLREIEARIEYFTKEKNFIFDTIAEKNEFLLFMKRNFQEADVQKANFRSRLSQVMQEIKQSALAHQALFFTDHSQDASNSASSLGPKSFSQRKGYLNWPLIVPSASNSLLQSIETNFSRDGIIITHNKDAQVIVVADGDVVFADNLSGYENLIIVDHGDGFHTLYGGMSESMVLLGNHLVFGQPIGYLQANHDLYFGIRFNGKSLEPLSWLKPN